MAERFWFSSQTHSQRLAGSQLLQFDLVNVERGGIAQLQVKPYVAQDSEIQISERGATHG